MILINLKIMNIKTFQAKKFHMKRKKKGPYYIFRKNTCKQYSIIYWYPFNYKQA